MGSLEFCIGIILPAALRPWRYSSSNRIEYREYFLGSKGDLFVGLATVPLPYAYSRECHEIWEPQLPCDLRPVQTCTEKEKEKELYFDSPFIVAWGRAVALWLMHYATNRQVAGSIPDGVIGIFQ
jgi:hypothetical protein